jgi:NAD(P)-dependent dehydrogenase (short-subunit alcohol dehydrogenase family)
MGSVSCSFHALATPTKKDDMRLAGKSVVITGAGSGVGRASALLFASEGAKVLCADVRKDWADDTVLMVSDAGGVASAQQCDVSVEADVEEAIGAAVSQFGRLDVIFNNAGITGLKPGQAFEEHTVGDFQRLVDVNFRGVFFGCKHAVGQFKAQAGGGVIVNTGSVAGMVGFGSVVYGATKGAVNQITKGVAIECAPFGIRCNAICPGTMPLTNFILADPDKPFVPPPDEYVGFAASLQPNGRIVTAEDCAAAALFLASDESTNITGVLLPVDGGYVAR